MVGIRNHAKAHVNVGLQPSGLKIYRADVLVEQNTAKTMDVAGRVVVMRLGQIVWDGLRRDIGHKDLGDLFLSRKPGEPSHDHRPPV